MRAKKKIINAAIFICILAIFIFIATESSRLLAQKTAQSEDNYINEFATSFFGKVTKKTETEIESGRMWEIEGNDKNLGYLVIRDVKSFENRVSIAVGLDDIGRIAGIKIFSANGIYEYEKEAFSDESLEKYIGLGNEIVIGTNIEAPKEHIRETEMIADTLNEIFRDSAKIWEDKPE